MGRHRELAASLLILVLMAYICEAALLRRSSATDFLRSGRVKRAARCVNGDCSSESSESEEILEANSDYEQENSKMVFPGGSQVGVLKSTNNSNNKSATLLKKMQINLSLPSRPARLTRPYGIRKLGNDLDCERHRSFVDKNGHTYSNAAFKCNL
ncbi:uncharacterized protein LOC106582949 isoform X2 [Tachysurus ichikawai]